MPTRRGFIQTGCVVAAAAVSARLWGMDGLYSGPIIDTHQHLWDLNRFELPWLPKDPANPLAGNHVISDYEKATAGLNIVQTVYMEVAVTPAQQRAEVEWVLERAREKPSKLVGAVVGGHPGESGFGDYVDWITTFPEVRGVRRVLHSSSTPPGHCLTPEFVKDIQKLGEKKLCFDLCLRPREIRDGAALAEQCPQTDFVLDHCGNAPWTVSGEPLWTEWKTGIELLSQRPNVIAKISGIVASAPERWKPRDLETVINITLDAFGENRVIFGSDWPVCKKRASFSEWVDALRYVVRNRSASFQKKLFYQNAQKFYNLPRFAEPA